MCGSAIPSLTPSTAAPLATPSYPPPPGFAAPPYPPPAYLPYPQYQPPHTYPIAQGPPAFRPPSATLARRSPQTALVLSAFLPGLGQLYNRNTAKGIFLATLVLYLVVLGGPTLVTHFLPYRFGAMLLAPTVLIWVFGMYDAYVCAKAGAGIAAKPEADPPV